MNNDGGLFWNYAVKTSYKPVDKLKSGKIVSSFAYLMYSIMRTQRALKKVIDFQTEKLCMHQHAETACTHNIEA